MTDRYANIRRALEMLDSAPADETMTLAAARDQFDSACDPDTIRELMAERDALAQENEAMRRCAIKYLGWLGVTHKPLDVALLEDMADPDMCGDAALNLTAA